MRAALLLSLSLAACTVPDVTLYGDVDGSTVNTPPAIDAAPGCLGIGLVVVCPTTSAAAQVSITSDRTLNTATDSPDCSDYTGTAGLCVFAVKTLIVASGARIYGVGPRPLALVASESIVIDGAVDVSSHLTQPLPAGANASECLTGAVPATRAGGPGGSFGSSGGAGASPSGASAPAAVPSQATKLRGGCPGANGNGANIGRGGAGGGAIALVAGNSIAIAGTLNASGSAGYGAGVNTGGGGAGSGGMIVLDAPTITISGTLFANGGGGGEGGGSSALGVNGSDPTMALTAARGGAGGAGGGGDGGAGSAGTISAATGLSASVTGGGGGGGAGVIRVFPPRALSGMVSPPPS